MAQSSFDGTQATARMVNGPRAVLYANVPPAQASDVLAVMLKGGSNKKAAALTEAAGGTVPPLTDLFAVGQYVRCVVAELREGGKQQDQQQGGGGGAARSSRHVCLSLLLKDVQGALGAEGLADGMVVGACVRSVEDHGYTLSFGIKVGSLETLEGGLVRLGRRMGHRGSGKLTGGCADAFGPQDGIEGERTAQVRESFGPLRAKRWAQAPQGKHAACAKAPHLQLS